MLTSVFRLRPQDGIYLHCCTNYDWTKGEYLRQFRLAGSTFWRCLIPLFPFCLSAGKGGKGSSSSKGMSYKGKGSSSSKGMGMSYKGKGSSSSKGMSYKGAYLLVLVYWKRNISSLFKPHIFCYVSLQAKAPAPRRACLTKVSVQH